METLCIFVNSNGHRVDLLPIFDFSLAYQYEPAYIILEAENYNPVPEVGDIYDPTTNTFSDPPPPPITDQIAELELSCTPRRLREAILGIDDGWLLDVNNEISDLRDQLPTTKESEDHA
jgi:hypothetical protein